MHCVTLSISYCKLAQCNARPSARRVLTTKLGVLEVSLAAKHFEYVFADDIFQNGRWDPTKIQRKVTWCYCCRMLSADILDMEYPGYGNVVILTKFSSLAASEVVKMITSGAAVDENFAIMTFAFLCRQLGGWGGCQYARPFETAALQYHVGFYAIWDS